MTISNRIFEMLYQYVRPNTRITCIKDCKLRVTINNVTRVFEVNIGDTATILSAVDKLKIRIDRYPDRYFYIRRDSIKDLVTPARINIHDTYWTFGDYYPVCGIRI